MWAGCGLEGFLGSSWILQWQDLDSAYRVLRIGPGLRSSVRWW